MNKALLGWLLLFSIHARAQTWNGTVSSSWNTAANWTPATVPTTTSNVVLNSATTPFKPILPGDVSIASLNMTAGKLDLAGFTLTCSGTATLAGDSLTSGRIVAGNIANFANNRVVGKLTLQKTGASSIAYHYGNNKVYADSLIILWGSGALYLQYGGVPDSVFGTLAISSTGTGTVYLGHNAGLYTSGDLALRAAGGGPFDLSTGQYKRIGGSVVWDAAFKTASLPMQNVQATGSGANGPFRCITGSMSNVQFAGSFSLAADSNQTFNVASSQFLGPSVAISAGYFNDFQNNTFNSVGAGGTTTLAAASNTSSSYNSYVGGNKYHGDLTFIVRTPAASGGNIFRPGYYAADSVAGSATYTLVNRASLAAGNGGGAQYVGGDLTLNASGVGHDITFIGSSATHRIVGRLIAQGFVPNLEDFNLDNITSSGTGSSGEFMCGAGSINNCSFAADFTVLADSARQFNITSSSFLGANNYFRAMEFFALTNNIFGQTGTGTTTHIAANNTANARNCYLGNNRIRNNWFFHAAPRAGSGRVTLYPNYYSADSCFGTATWELSNFSSLNANNAADTAYVAGNLILDLNGESHDITFGSSGAQYIGGSLVGQGFAGNVDGALDIYDVTAVGTAANGPFECATGIMQNCSFAGDVTVTADSSQVFSLLSSRFLGANNFFKARDFFVMKNNVFGQAGTGTTTHIAATNTAFGGNTYLGNNRILNNWTFHTSSGAGAGIGVNTLHPNYYTADSCFGTAVWKFSNNSALSANTANDTAYVAGNLILDADGGSHPITFSSSGAQVVGGALQAQNFSANTAAFVLADVWAPGAAPTGTFRCGAGSIDRCIFGGAFALVADSGQNFNIQNSAFNGADNSFQAGQFFQLRDNVFGQTGSGLTTHISTNNTPFGAGHNNYLGGNRIRNNWLLHAAPRAGSALVTFWPNYYNADSCFGAATWKLSNNSSLNANNANDTAYVAGNLILDADGTGHSITFNTTGAQYIGGSLQAQNFVPAVVVLNFHDITSAGTAASGVFHSGNTTVENCSFAGDFTMLADSSQNFTVSGSRFLGANNLLRAGQFFNFTNNIFGQAGTGNTTIAATNKTTGAYVGYDGGNRYRGPLTHILYAPAAGSQTWNQSYYSADSMGGAFTLQCFGAATANLASQTAAFFGGDISIGNVGTGTVQSAASTALTMYGTDTATFSYTGTEPILRRIRMNKTGGLRLLSPLRIHTALVLDTGVILTTLANMLIVPDGATVTGLQKLSFVDGPMKKIGNDVFSFPVGDGGLPAPIGITAPTVVTDEFVARYYRIPPHSAGYDTSQHDASIRRLSAQEYWTLERTAGTSGVRVTLSHDTARSGLITSQSALLVAHWKGAPPSWQSEGSGTTTGNIYAGTVQSAAIVSTFSPFTLGSTSQGTPLVSENLLLDATRAGRVAKLAWRAPGLDAVESFVVERSADGKSFDELAFIAANASISSGDYFHTDAQPLTGRNYYRIRAVQRHGSAVFSAVRTLLFESTDVVGFYPNPATNLLHVSLPAGMEGARVKVLGADGRVVLETSVRDGEAVDVSRLAAGMYWLEVGDGKSMVQRTTFVKQ